MSTKQGAKAKSVRHILKVIEIYDVLIVVVVVAAAASALDVSNTGVGMAHTRMEANVELHGSGSVVS